MGQIKLTSAPSGVAACAVFIAAACLLAGAQAQVSAVPPNPAAATAVSPAEGRTTLPALQEIQLNQQVAYAAPNMTETLNATLNGTLPEGFELNATTAANCSNPCYVVKDYYPYKTCKAECNPEVCSRGGHSGCSLRD
jgi:hypothetical protein